MLIVFHKVTARDWPSGRYNYQLTDSGKQIQIIKFYLPKNIKACFLAGSVAAGAATFFMPWGGLKRIEEGVMEGVMVMSVHYAISIKLF